MNSEQFPPNRIPKSPEVSAKPSKPIKKPIPKGSAVDLPPPPPLIELSGNTPIPRASEPLQYRAIGLVKGRYLPSAEEFTRGTVLADDQTLIDAVLLGRVMSLVKNHINVNQSHVWVVYPRLRKDDGKLHIQIMGIWEPELVIQPVTENTTPDEEPQLIENTPDPLELRPLEIPDNYFSIRGEVIFQARDKKEIFVKIKQIPRKKDETMKYFKLRLVGDFATKMVGHFWEFDVKREGDELIIITGKEVASLKVPVKKNTRKPEGTTSSPVGKKPFKKFENDSPPIDRPSPSINPSKTKPSATSRPLPPRLDIPKND